MHIHRKIIIDDSVLGDVAFGDWYRFGDPEKGPRSLIHYIGGSITRAVYLSRLKGEPTPVVDEFQSAWERSGMPAVDLLVSSSPPCGESRQNGILQDFFSHLLFEILPRTDNPRPPAMAFVGNSFGAHLASYLAFSLAGARVLATIAGCGMTDAALQTPLQHLESKLFMVFSNLDDGTEYEDEEFRRFLEARDIALTIERRPGGHDFDDYRTNGSLKDAFIGCLYAVNSTQTIKTPSSIINKAFMRYFR